MQRSALPEHHHDQFKQWLGRLTDTADIFAVIRGIPGVIRTVRHLRRVSRPGGGALSDGLIVALRDAKADGQTLSEDELVSMIFLLFGAGQETTTHLIAGGLFALLSHDQLRRLQRDPQLMPTCVEECLRYVSPVQMTKPRFATRDMTWMGSQFRRGERVAAFLAAANCDPAKFKDEPHRFDIGRRPNPHLSFGTGVHFCIGFQLARAEAAIAFERVIAGFPDLRLAIEPQRMEWHRRPGIRALQKLPLRLVG